MSRIGYIGLGSNMGDRLEWLRRALDALHAHDAITVHESSSIYETPPMYVLEQPTFLNSCAKISTTLDPHALLGVLLKIEHALGRRREVDRGPRTLDLDLLWYEDHVCDDVDLTLPHPGLHERAFVLIPLVEIAAHLVHPTLHSSMSELLERCLGREACKLYQPA